MLLGIEFYLDIKYNTRRILSLTKIKLFQDRGFPFEKGCRFITKLLELPTHAFVLIRLHEKD